MLITDFVRYFLDKFPGAHPQAADVTPPQEPAWGAEIKAHVDFETKKAKHHATLLVAIYAQDKAHVKALYTAWQNAKKKATIYKPGSVNEVKATRRAAIARKEWQAANNLFLKHFGDYAP